MTATCRRLPAGPWSISSRWRATPGWTKRALRLLGKARMLAKVSGETEHVYGEARYAARTWSRKRRRIIAKAEVVCHPGRPPKTRMSER